MLSIANIWLTSEILDNTSYKHIVWCKQSQLHIKRCQQTILMAVVAVFGSDHRVCPTYGIIFVIGLRRAVAKDEKFKGAGVSETKAKTINETPIQKQTNPLSNTPSSPFRQRQPNQQDDTKHAKRQDT